MKLSGFWPGLRPSRCRRTQLADWMAGYSCFCKMQQTQRAQGARAQSVCAIPRQQKSDNDLLHSVALKNAWNHNKSRSVGQPWAAKKTKASRKSHSFHTQKSRQLSANKPLPNLEISNPKASASKKQDSLAQMNSIALQ